MKRAIGAILILSMAGIAGCNEDPTGSHEPFEITVRDQTSQPVAGATVEGGIDWDFYRVQTNANGQATLPGSARGDRAVIYKTNHLPKVVSAVSPAAYTLNLTSRKLDLIGDAVGKAIRFGVNQLLTLDYGGTYHVYAFTDQSVTEIFSQRLHDSARAVREIHLSGDTLWFTTHDSGIFVFLIQNPAAPQFLFRLLIQGYLGPFALKDSVLVLGDAWGPGPLRIMRYYPHGPCQEIARVPNYFVRKMARIGNAVILLGNGESLPTIFDIANPLTPRLLYNGLEWEYTTGFFFDRFVILTPRYAYGGNLIILDYKVLDLSNPASPRQMNPFSADSWITGLASSTNAYGNSYAHTQTINVLEGGMASSFQTVATVSENTIDGVGGTSPPYYLIGNRLWKLVNR